LRRAGGVEDGDSPLAAAPLGDEAGRLQVGGGLVDGEREDQERRGAQERVAARDEDGLVGGRVGQQRLDLARPCASARRPSEQVEVVVAQVLEPAVHLPAAYPGDLLALSASASIAAGTSRRTWPVISIACRRGRS
jgi:hypothetical protein